MNYEELVKALRCANRYKNFTKDCDSQNPNEPCRYCHHWLCEDDRIFEDAAAAIEALQKRIVSALTALHLANEKMGYYGIQPYTEADGEDMISDWVKTLVHEELKQQLPKRGEWELIDEAEPMRWGCSRCKYLSWETSSYCPRCGAKMEVQDESTGSV